MNAPWNPPATLPPNKRVVLLFNFPVANGDGGSHVPVSHVGTFHPGHVSEPGRFIFTGPPTKQVHSYPMHWLAAWTEVPS